MKSRYLVLALAASLGACGAENDDKPTPENPVLTDHTYPVDTTHPVEVNDPISCVEYCRRFFSQLCSNVTITDEKGVTAPLDGTEVVDPSTIEAGDVTFTCKDDGRKHVEWEGDELRSCNEVCAEEYGMDCVWTDRPHNGFNDYDGEGICELPSSK